MSTTLRDRRKSPRVRTQLDARWEGILSSHQATVVDISTSGCFVLTSGEVQPRELVRLEITTLTERRIYLWGEVVYHEPEMGFAVRFTGSDEIERKMLGIFLDYLQDTHSER